MGEVQVCDIRMFCVIMKAHVRLLFSFTAY